MVFAGTLYAWEFERDGEALDVSVTGRLTFSAPELMLDAAVGGPVSVTSSKARSPLTSPTGASWFHPYYPSRVETERKRYPMSNR